MNQCFLILAHVLIVIKCCCALTYTDQWAVHVEGGETVARQLAEKHGFTYITQIMTDYYLLRHHHVSKRSIYPSTHIHKPLSEEPQVKWIEQQVAKKRVKRDISFNDPKWPRMWYLNRGHGLDMNVMAAWERDITGKGVVVSILDDGIERDHPDLKKNYDPRASYDVNNHDSDPTPRYDYTNENRHGTRCAGEVAAEAGNGVCSVGVAYEARIGGVRMLDGDVTDGVEAQSLSLNPQHIDIYSASWGPDDDGQTVDGPAPLARKAFEDGITKGRSGRGSIFVWASGNGGREGDSCNCDGYTNSIYTLSISSATEHGHVPWYSEACSSTLATTYSSGSGGERQIVTTDLRKDCTEYHTGTSASAPLAAGICALVLQANPSLTWRDMQHIVVETARPANLNTDDWVVNGVNRKVSHHFGFGLMDAGAMVQRALNWTNVPQQHKCIIHANMEPRRIPVNNIVSFPLESNGCHGTSQEVVYLEHVQAVVTLGASKRGQVRISLVSPAGTKSVLLAKRDHDTSSEGFDNWAFMTTHNWGEMSFGTWKLEVSNSGTNSVLKNWSLVLYGTATHPQAGYNVQRHPVNPNQGKKKRIRRKRRKTKHRRSKHHLLSIKVTGPHYLERGRRLEIICNATGQRKTPKSVKWFKDGRRFHSNPPKGVMVVKRRENHSLITLLSIEKTKIRDCGEYVCLWRKQKADSLNVHIVKHKKTGHSPRLLSPFSDPTSADRLSPASPWYYRSSQRYYKW